MSRFFKNIFGIIIGAIVLFLMIKLPLADIPYIQYILGVLIVGIILFYAYKLYQLSHPKKKNILKLFILMVVLLLTGTEVYAQWDNSAQKAGEFLVNSLASYCSDAEAYFKKTINAQAHNGEGDEPCLQFRLENARNILESKRLNVSGFNPPDDFMTERLRNPDDGVSFRKARNWDKWVSDNFQGTDEEKEGMACMVYYVNLCSEWERRHPQPKARTVREILTLEAKKNGCWPCEMASIFLVVVQFLSVRLNEAMCEAGLNFLKILMIVWILYAVFQAVVFPSKGVEFIKTLFVRFLCMIMVIMLLANQNSLQQLYKYFLTPFLSLGIGISQEINSNLSAKVGFGEEIYQQINTSGVKNYCLVPNASVTSGKQKLDVEAVFVGPELRTSLLCMTQTLYRQISPITAIGKSILSYSMQDRSLPIAMVGFPHMKRWFVGVTILLLFSLYSFSIAFRIIDIFVKFGFILVLMPLFVAATVFPVTREFTKKAFMFFMKTMTDFLALTMAVNFVIIMFENGIAVDREKFKQVILTEKGGTEYIEMLMGTVTSGGAWRCFFSLIALFLFANLLLKSSITILAEIFGANTGISLDVGASVVGVVQKGVSMVQGIANKAAQIGEGSGDDGKGAKKVLNTAKKFASSSKGKKTLADQAGDAVDSAAQKTGKAIDKAGTKAGQALSKTGYGAVIGVPLIAVAKTTRAGMWVAGKTTKMALKAAGRVASFAKRSFNKAKAKKK